MSLFFRARERRDAFPEPPLPPNSAQGFGGSFDQIYLGRAEASLQKVAVWASANLIATLATTLPLDVFTEQGGSARQVDAPPMFRDPDGSGHGMPDWLYMLLMSWLLRGNVYGLVLDRDSMGRPSQIDLIHPDEIAPTRDTTDGRVTWRVRGVEVDRDRVWHRRLFPVPGQVLGLSPIGLHITTVSAGLAAQRFGLQWFTDGGHPSAVLTNENVREINQAQATTLKQRFLAAARGSREPIVLAQGWKYQAIQVAPNESQFLETQKYTAAECARIFGPGLPEMLGYDTGGSLTYANVEQRSLDMLTYTMDPWLVRVERVLSELTPRSQYVKLNRGALLRTDLLTRFRAHEIALRNEWETINEVRALEDEPPVPWGNEPRPIRAPAAPSPMQEQP